MRTRHALLVAGAGGDLVAKPNPGKVDAELAMMALRETKQRTHFWTQYILAHYHSTGDLAPGCDYRDLTAWCEQNVTGWVMMWDAKGTKVQT